MRADSSQVHGAPVIRAPQQENDRGLSTAFASPLLRLRPFTAVHGRALSRGSFCPTLTHLASVACGIQPFHSACVSVMTGARESKKRVQLVSCRHEHHRDTLAMQSLPLTPPRALSAPTAAATAATTCCGSS